MGITHSLPRLATGIALIMAMTFSCRTVVAEPEHTSAKVMSGCRDLASMIQFSNGGEDPYRMGVCSGMITGLGLLGRNYDVCIPAGTSSRQAANVIVQYVDGRPEPTDEEFVRLVIQALKDAWPCPVETKAELIKDWPLLSGAKRQSPQVR